MHLDFIRKTRQNAFLSVLNIRGILLCVIAFSYLESTFADSYEKLYDNYIIQPGDTLFISVWKEQDLQADILVRPDGKFSFPLIGEVDVQGKNMEQLRQEVAQRIKKFVSDADVLVAARQLQGNKVYVIGKVNRPGEFPMNRPLDVMQALSVAGGMTQFADDDDIIIIRRKKSEQKVFRFDYGEVERGENLKQNILLHSGDVVVVP